MPPPATIDAPYRSTAPEPARTLVHPRRLTREVVVGAVAWLCVAGVVWQFLLQASAGFVAVSVTLALVIAATASFLALRRSLLSFVPASRRLRVVYRRGDAPGSAQSIEVGESDRLAIQTITPTNFRLLLTSPVRPPLPLTDELVLDEAQVRAEFVRVHQFLFPESPLPVLPAGSLLPVCVAAALTPPRASARDSEA
jgi:hypothetical protein